MKCKNKWIVRLIAISLFIIIWPPFLFAQSTQNNGLKFRIILDKWNYLLNEPLWVTVIVENTTDDKVFAVSADPFYGNVHFHIVASNGDSLEGWCLRGMTGGYPTLDPGQKDLYFVDLVGPICTFGVEHEEALHQRRIPEGKYTLQAELRIYPDPKWQKERFQVYSDKVNFMVQKPSGQEKKAYDLLRDKEVEKLWTIVKQYPNSVYKDAAYDILSLNFHHREPTLEFIDKNPNSGFVASAIFAAIPKNGKPKEREDFLKYIIKTYPNTKAAMYAENYLDKWKRGKIWVDEPID
jgi:hypothetical protein